MNDSLAILETVGFFPIVEVKKKESVRLLAETLLSCGLPIIEIPLRTDAALDAMRIVRDEYPGMLLGAGTVLSPHAADEAHTAGARFMLAPGFNPHVVDYCLDKGYEFVPGISSPTGVELALEKGVRAVKFFPAAELGGLRFLKAMSAPFSEIRYVPTGGVHNGNLVEYLDDPRVLACGGTWIAKADLVESGRTDEIKRVVESAFHAVLALRTEAPRRGGSKPEPDDVRKLLGELLPQGEAVVSKKSQSVAMSDDGTIEISTRDLRKAAAFCERRGFDIAREGAETVEVRRSDLGCRVRMTERKRS
jgi:2-dehydro-3-deoxyphosphogluconate aldolase/(4S)-4-hydroxy-2-oxoglutarate aldolase